MFEGREKILKTKERKPAVRKPAVNEKTITTKSFVWKTPTNGTVTSTSWKLYSAKRLTPTTIREIRIAYKIRISVIV